MFCYQLTLVDRFDIDIERFNMVVDRFDLHIERFDTMWKSTNYDPTSYLIESAMPPFDAP